jgi:hypothetical protein
MILRFCGSTDVFCLPCHGCQSGCSSGSSCPVATPTSTPTPAPDLTTAQKNGIIIGSVLSVTVLAVLGLLFFCYKERTKRQLLNRSGRVTLSMEFPPGTAGADLARQIAVNGNRLFLPAPPNGTYSPYDRGTGRIYGPPSYSASEVSTPPCIALTKFL